MQAELAICRQLQKTFKTIQEQSEQWKLTLETCQKDMTSLENLAEQYQCCAKVDLLQTPLAQSFPDIKEKLLYKLHDEMADMINRLQDILSAQNILKDKVSHQAEQCMDLYSKYAGQLTMKKMTECSPLWPSMATMLQWVQDFSRLYREDILCKQHTLEVFSPDKPEAVSSLVEHWKMNKMLQQQMEELLPLVAFFQQEQF
ncbi:uncharacterized protein C1orf109 [Lingula anatina]|uniref:Uncharacterized protein C1orf109 n=1 Tax=Lingula anatina TaxID=7574 RepID=A0A1S3H9J9_LINAN|nr:uncharacterized protein C1orf109 [Lingula anatina]|eukprot:XP_013382683.1 uncharacterized protein C1orf109 [Lingula anatina]